MKMFSMTTKTMLKNVIRHTDTHNRIVEESDMWKQLDQVKHREGDSKWSFLYDDRHDMSSDARLHGSRHAYMDDRDDDNDNRTSTFWQRQLQKAEEADPDRWGHSGFKELYPQNFKSDRSDDSEDDVKTHKKRWGHSGFKELYPQNFKSDRSDDSEDSVKTHKKRKKERKKKKHKKDKGERKHKDGNKLSSGKHKSKSRKSRIKSSSESDQKSDFSSTRQATYTQVDDFQWNEKNRNRYGEKFGHRDKTEKCSKNRYEKGHCVKIVLVNKLDDGGLRESYKDGNNERRRLDHCHDDRDRDKREDQDPSRGDRCTDKKKRAIEFPDDVNESLRKKKRSTKSDASQCLPDSVHNDSVNSYNSGHVDSETGANRKKTSKKHKSKHKSKKKHRQSREL